MAISISVTPGEKHDGDSLYALVGEYATVFQQLEDSLAYVIASAIFGQNLSKAFAFFETQRGLDTRLRVIEIALSDAPAELQEGWKKLSARVKAAAQIRGQLVHAHPITVGQVKLIERLDGSADVFQANPEFHLQKATKGGSQLWNLNRMSQERKKLIALFHDLEKFSFTLTNGEPFNQ